MRARNLTTEPGFFSGRILARVALAAALVFGALGGGARAADGDFNYLVGRGMRDVTGPAVGVQMFGFVRADQIDEGIHLRLRARAFVVAEPGEKGKRVAFVCVEMGCTTHEIVRGAIEKLHERFGDLYRLDNVIISATHTHAGPGSFWHYGANTPINGPFYQEHYDAVVRGIVEAVAAAHEDLQPGKILISRGKVENAGANRSAVAYMNNPETERAQYDSDTDKEMTLLKFVDATGEIGCLNWFAVHPTCMTYYNKLISGDHKGYASLKFERARGTTYEKKEDFVAAFAQSNCGDVTGNLNLDNTGPGKDEFETTKIIGSRQLEKAEELFKGAKERVEGPIDFRFEYADFSGLPIQERFTQAGPQATCPAAYGYSFAAGSTEDGGGLPMFREGMKERLPMIDGMVKGFGGLPEPSQAVRDCQAPKAVLFAPGVTNPPSIGQTIPLSIMRIGQLFLVAGPSEYTTMAGRRIRKAVASEIGDAAKYVVIAGYSNSFIGYTTTPEEYETQQYEGGHTLFGKWTLPAYVQEFSKLAHAMQAGEAVDRGPTPDDPRARTWATPLETAYDAPPEGKELGGEEEKPKGSHKRGETATASFWAGDPRNGYETGGSYMAVERQEGSKWTRVATDSDWETKIRWTKPFAPKKAPAGKPGQPGLPVAGAKPGGAAKANGSAKEPAAPPVPDAEFISKATITWDIPEDAKPGTYRITFEGKRKKKEGGLEPVKAASGSFKVE